MSDSLIEILRRGQPDGELEAPRGSVSDYADRNGYAPGFLGASEAFRIPLPLLRDQADLTPVEGAPAASPFELRYRNFSVAMSRSRQLCCVTAVNIDGGAPFFHPKRPGWRLDPRIGSKQQIGGADFYVPTSFDRGHMVRRLDPVWGLEGNALLANRDTHHYTNACPQAHSFNDGEWGNLEDWILSQEQSRGSQGSVFTGPVLQADDPVYHTIAVPVLFYKIVAVVDDDKDELSVTAFLLDQTDMLPPREEEARLERPFDPGRFRMSQVTVAALESSAGMDFGVLRDFDVLARLPVPEGLEQPLRELPLISIRDAVLWRP